MAAEDRKFPLWEGRAGLFKLAAFTDEISQDLEHALSVCREYELERLRKILEGI